MSKITFFSTPEFEREFKRLKKKYRSLPDDLREFKEEFLKNPSSGTDLGSNIRKIRVSIKSKGKGKSGGARIIIYDIVADITSKGIVLITIYDKSETEAISISQIKNILNRNGF